MQNSKLIMIWFVIQGLEYLMGHSVVHGDIRCANIYLTKDFAPKICNFGWSKEFTTDLQQTGYVRKEPTLHRQW